MQVEGGSEVVVVGVHGGELEEIDLAERHPLLGQGRGVNECVYDAGISQPDRAVIRIEDEARKELSHDEVPSTVAVCELPRSGADDQTTAQVYEMSYNEGAVDNSLGNVSE